MCHSSVLDFFRSELTASEIAGRRILEVGARDVNGSVRPFLMSLGARDYVGVDIEPGPSVDVVCDVAELAEKFAGDPFDVVVTTEMLEHVRDWRVVISNLKRVVAPGGLLILTTRSYGFPYHSFPDDYWRYELDDMRWIFRDFQVVSLLPDPLFPGVFLKGMKPREFREADVSGRELFSVVRGAPAEPDSFTDEEVDVYARRAVQIGEAGVTIKNVLLRVDLADVGRRDFRNLWRSVARLADRIDQAKSRGPSRSASARLRRASVRLRCRALDWLTVARLARGRYFAKARAALLVLAGSGMSANVLRVPWGRLEGERFGEILDAARSLEAQCLKVQSYARPAARG